jgi:hypothetical protein
VSFLLIDFDSMKTLACDTPVDPAQSLVYLKVKTTQSREEKARVRGEQRQRLLETGTEMDSNREAQSHSEAAAETKGQRQRER